MNIIFYVKNPKKSCSIYSKTRNIDDVKLLEMEGFVAIISINLIIFGWFIFFSNLISLIAAIGKPVYYLLPNFY